MKVVDGFPFFNELDLLELRLMELDSVVDYFVLVEASTTQRGEPKPFYFDENKERYAPWAHKICHVMLHSAPSPILGGTKEELWVAERWQREAIKRGWEEVGVATGDIVMVSDADEIPHPSIVSAEGLTPTYPSLYYYYVNCRANKGFPGTVALKVDRRGPGSPQILRNWGWKYRPNTLPHQGWHYSHLAGGDPAKIRAKYDSTIESMLLDGGRRLAADTLVGHMQTLQDPWSGTRSRDQHLSIVDISEDKPAALDAWLEKHPQYLWRNDGLSAAVAGSPPA